MLQTTASGPTVEYLCWTCAGREETPAPAPSTAARCYACGVEVSPASAQPVFVDGHFQLHCGDCDAHARRPAAAPTPLAADRETAVPGRPISNASRVLMAAGAIAAGIAAAVVFSAPSVAEDSAEQAKTPQVVPLEIDVGHESHTMEFADVALAPSDEPLAHELSVPTDFTFDEWKKGLLDTVVWYHPIAGDKRDMPDRATRRFGAKRPPSRPECGKGHCGVDVGFKRGLIVHTASYGTVDRVVHDPDSRSGRYVKIVHPSGYSTWYMHLDKIRHDLQKGVEVGAGEALGTVGRTGIQKSEAHLHFGVSKAHRGREFFIDPEPMLRQAIVLEEPAPFRSHFNN